MIDWLYTLRFIGNDRNWSSFRVLSLILHWLLNIFPYFVRLVHQLTGENIDWLLRNCEIVTIIYTWRRLTDVFYRNVGVPQNAKWFVHSFSRRPDTPSSDVLHENVAVSVKDHTLHTDVFYKKIRSVHNVYVSKHRVYQGIIRESFECSEMFRIN